ncbi:hypothetical protein GUJ93_ZPchr0005g15783 [Zizania palustris]|uniref:PH domain-containing protein n=1 Tax=Zizania palustris TaxID=103762 RepID=A0A8J5SQB2_ZIZPA|nr:hypothetical protein GUJ93_ZPchr0005g15783 [Zizania palustris]
MRSLPSSSSRIVHLYLPEEEKSVKFTVLPSSKLRRRLPVPTTFPLSLLRRPDLAPPLAAAPTWLSHSPPHPSVCSSSGYVAGWMDDVYGRIEVFPQHFIPSQESMESADGLSTSKANLDSPQSSRRRSWTPKKVIGAASLLHLLSLPRIRWSSSNEDDDKIELSRAEVESLRTEIADAEERESQLKARLENIDEVLRYALLSGYLYIRSRWTQLPGEPPILDDAEVDDWLPRFVVLQGQCIYYYLKSTDLSPQESTLLCDIVEVGQLPDFVPEDEKTRYSFYIMTRQGLKFECSSMSEIQVVSWIRALRRDCRLPDGAGCE